MPIFFCWGAAPSLEAGDCNLRTSTRLLNTKVSHLLVVVQVSVMQGKLGRARLVFVVWLLLLGVTCTVSG